MRGSCPCFECQVVANIDTNYIMEGLEGMLVGIPIVFGNGVGGK